MVGVSSYFSTFSTFLCFFILYFCFFIYLSLFYGKRVMYDRLYFGMYFCFNSLARLCFYGKVMCFRLYFILFIDVFVYERWEDVCIRLHFLIHLFIFVFLFAKMTFTWLLFFPFVLLFCTSLYVSFLHSVSKLLLLLLLFSHFIVTLR